MRTRSWSLWALYLATTASCALIVNPDLEGLEAYPAETGAPDAQTGGEPVGSDTDVDSDRVRDADADDADDVPDVEAALDGPDAFDAEGGTTSDGGERRVFVTGGFVAPPVVPAPTSQYQIVGRIVSTPRIRGTTTSGFLIEGWLQ
jgi:hypothetical protein